MADNFLISRIYFLENFGIVNGWHKFPSTKCQRRHPVCRKFLCVCVLEEGIPLQSGLTPQGSYYGNPKPYPHLSWALVNQIITKSFKSPVFFQRQGERMLWLLPQKFHESKELEKEVAERNIRKHTGPTFFLIESSGTLRRIRAQGGCHQSEGGKTFAGVGSIAQHWPSNRKFHFPATLHLFDGAVRTYLS